MNVSRGYRYLSNFLLVALIGLLYFGTAHPGVTSVMGSLYNGPLYKGTMKDAVSIQVVVDWNAAAIEPMLDTLKSANTRITFCVSGAWARENEDLLLRMVDEGHEIAISGMYPHQDGDREWVQSDVSQAIAVIKEIAAITPKIYYSGNRDIAVSGSVAKKLNLSYVLCSVDLLCARGDAADILNRALDGVFDGSIFLMQPTKAASVALLPILERMQQLNKEVVPTGELIGIYGT